MKRFLLLLLALMCVCLPALGESRVIDRADVLTAAEESQLEAAIAQVRSQYAFDVVLLTETSISQTPRYYAADFYDYGGYGEGADHDSILLLLVTGAGMGDRDYFILTTGRAERVFSTSVLYDVEDAFLPFLRQNRFAAGMAAFVVQVEDHLTAYTPLNRANRLLPVLLGAGLVVALIVVGILKGQLKTVRRKQDAASYVRSGSFHLTRAQDVYLYTSTARHRIEASSSPGGHSGGGGFTGSSGTHHGGHGGKF